MAKESQKSRRRDRDVKPVNSRVRRRSRGADPASGWRVRLFRDSADRVYAEYRFPTRDHRRSRVQVPVSQLRSRKLLLDMIEDHFPAFPADVSPGDADRVKFLRDLVHHTRTQVRWMPTRTGFHDAATFVSHDEVITGKDRKARHRAERLARPVRTGTAEGERAGVLYLAKSSTYLSFAIGVALAGPLLSYVRLATRGGGNSAPLLKESATFNFCGSSSTGKSSACEAALSIIGTVGDTGKLNFTQRGLAEWAADNNDMLLVCDDAEEGNHLTRDQQVAQFQNLAHMIPSGSYKLMSKGTGAAPASALRWSLFNLTSSLEPISRISSRCHWTMSPGDQVRLFDIPVPAPALGGIFDVISPGLASKGKTSADLISQLALEMAINRGNTFPLWVQFLLKEDRTDEVRELTNRFVLKTGPHSNGWETRFAEKFGAIYSAMRLGVTAGILPWNNKHPLKVAERCYRLARGTVSDATPVEGLSTTLGALLSKAGSIINATGDESVLEIGPDVVAIKFRKKNRTFIGVLDSSLKLRLGNQGRNEFIKNLRDNNLLEPGDGHAGTSQERVPVLLGGKFIKRPRLWVMRAKKIRSYIRSETPQGGPIAKHTRR